MLRQLYNIPNLDLLTFNNLSSNTSMTSHGIVASSPEILFHSAAGTANSCSFQQYLSNLKSLMLQGQQVDASDHNVLPQQLWWNLTPAQCSSHSVQMLLLN